MEKKPKEINMNENNEAAWVYLDNQKQWVNTNSVEFLDISEDIFGRDNMTFKYKSRIYSSILVLGSRPN